MKKNRSTLKLGVFNTSFLVYNMAKLTKETEEIQHSQQGRCYDVHTECFTFQ